MDMAKFDSVEFLDECHLMCCSLCPDIKIVLHSLINHIKKEHFDDINFPLNSLTNICNCQDSIELQYQLINHLISATIRLEIGPVSLKDQPNPKIHIEQDILDIKPTPNHLRPSKKRGRKPKPLNPLSNLPKSTPVTYLPPIRHSHLTTNPQFPCDYCPKILYTKSGLSKHYNIMHNPNNKFKCTLCSAGHCNTLKNLHAHIRTHDHVQLDTKTCQKCNKNFQTEKQFYHHMLLHRQKLLECDHCGMRFNMKQPLLKHIFTHFDIRMPRENETKSLCEICSKLVASSRMKRHLATHFVDNKTTYQCDYPDCEKSFTEMRNLQDHQNMHKNLRPYVCEFCCLAFRHRAALRQHRMRHTEPEKHKCEVCLECFVTNQSLRKHMTRQHQDVGRDSRSFACDYEGCTSTFKYEDFLVRHKKDVHNPKPQIEKSCEHCSYVAHNTKNYFQHMRRSHNIRKRINNRVFPVSAMAYPSTD